MEKESLIVCDTNILIEVIDRNNQTVIERLVQLGLSRLRISSVSYSELLIGAQDKAHQRKLVNELNRFEILPITPAQDLIYRQLLLRYSLSHGLVIQDAIIAASAIEHDARLYTLNKKDFRFISGLELV